MIADHPVRNGLFAGVLLMVLSVSFYVIDNIAILLSTRILSYVIVVFFMVKSITATRTVQSGLINIKEAFKTAWLTFVLAGALAAVFTFILYNYVDPGMKLHIKEMQIQGFNYIAEKFTISEQDNQIFLDNIKNNDSFGIRSIAVDLPFSFIFPGALISLILALIMKKESISKI